LKDVCGLGGGGGSKEAFENLLLENMLCYPTNTSHIIAQIYKEMRAGVEICEKAEVHLLILCNVHRYFSKQNILAIPHFVGFQIGWLKKFFSQSGKKETLQHEIRFNFQFCEEQYSTWQRTSQTVF
jgi:hypothetical protein